MGKNAQIRQKPKRTRIEQRKSEGIAFAVARNIRISPRKVRRVINLIRGKAYQEALAILNFTPTPATEPVRKVLQSAGANADHNLSLTIERLYVKTCFVDAGISFKRMHPTTQGRARIIKRRSCHITIHVAEQASARSRAPRTA